MKTQISILLIMLLIFSGCSKDDDSNKEEESSCLSDDFTGMVVTNRGDTVCSGNVCNTEFSFQNITDCRMQVLVHLKFDRVDGINQSDKVIYSSTIEIDGEVSTSINTEPETNITSEIQEIYLCKDIANGCTW